MSIKQSLRSSDRARVLATAALSALARARFRAGSRGTGNRLEIGDGCVTRGVRFQIEGNDNVVRIGAGARLHDLRIRIQGDGNRIVLGERVAFVQWGILRLEGDANELSIGADSTVEAATLGVMEATALRIGSGCLLAWQVEIRTGDSHRIFDRESGERINPSQSVSIGERVWLGKRSVVLKNVSIADGVIIGAGGMVTRSIGEENAVAVGNPARVVRHGVRWTQ